jgi:hypothetical protein
LFGRGDYTLDEAQDVNAPSDLPGPVAAGSRLIGKIVIEKSAASFTSVASAFDTSFDYVSPTTHNNLVGLQGGTSAEYYHLTSADYTALTDAQAQLSSLHTDTSPTFASVITDTVSEATATNGVSVDGVKLKDGGVTCTSAIAMGTNKVTGMGEPTVSTDAATKNYVDTYTHNSLASLQGGTTDEYYHLTSAQHADALCTAWVRFDGTGTVAIGDSFNVSSITDVSAGSYEVNFTTTMVNSNYAVSITTSDNNVVFTSACIQDGTAATTSKFRFVCARMDTGASPTDYDVQNVNVIVFGGV